MGVLRRRKENDKVFQWHNTAQIKSEICGISKRQMFNIKRASSSSKSSKRILLSWRLLAKICFSKDLICFRPATLLKRDSDTGNTFFTEYLWTTASANSVNGTESLDFVLMLCLQPVTLLKLRLRHRCFLVNFGNFFGLQLYWKQDSGAGVFLWSFFPNCSFNKSDTSTQ